MPVQETARRASPSCARLDLPVGAVIVNATRPPLLRRAAAAADGQADAARARPGSRPGCRPTQDVVAGAGRRGAEHAGRGAVEDGAARRAGASSAGRCSSCRCCPSGVDLGGLYELADAARRRARVTRERPSARPPRPATSTRCSTTRRPGSSSAAAPAASARPPPRRRSALRAAERGRRRSCAHHRPGPAAGPVAGPDRAGQHPAPGRRASTRGRRRRAARDDARHEADLRRDRAAHADPERAEEILANPFYQAMSSTFAGTQEYMAMEKLGQLRGHATSGT